MDGVLIHRATPADAWRVRTLRLAALRDSPAAFTSTFEREVSQPIGFWEDRLRRALTLLIQSGGVDMGMLTVAALEAPGDRAFYGLWVAPDARGEGLGGRLVAAGLDAAWSAGAQRVVLSVTAGNEAAMALYGRHGFRPTGRSGDEVELAVTR